MTSLANPGGSRYAYRQLSNVVITSYPLPGKKACIEDFDTLHSVIMLGLVKRPGLLNREEIKALREELGYKTPEDLAQMLDAPDRIVRMAEKGQLELAVHSDVELRRLVYTHFELPLPDLDELYELVRAPRNNNFVVRIEPDQEQVWKLAA